MSTSTTSNVTVNDLAIPDTYCSPDKPEDSHQCPERFLCMELMLSPRERGFNGFDEFGKFSTPCSPHAPPTIDKSTSLFCILHHSLLIRISFCSIDRCTV